MTVKRTSLGGHRSYEGSIEELNGLPPAEDQKLDEAEVQEIDEAIGNHADEIEAIKPLLLPDLPTMTFDAPQSVTSSPSSGETSNPSTPTDEPDPTSMGF